MRDPETDMKDRSRATMGSTAALVVILLALSFSSVSLAQDPIELDGPGIAWDLPESHMLYLKGTVNEPFLDRNWSTNTGEPLGKAEFTRTSSSLNPNLIDIQSAPLSNSFRFEGNLTVRLFASVDDKRSQELYRYETPAPTMAMGLCGIVTILTILTTTNYSSSNYSSSNYSSSISNNYIYFFFF